MQRGQRERGRLAGAGLGAAHQVAAGEHRRNGLQLDRRRRLVALGANGAEQRIGEAQIDQKFVTKCLNLSHKGNLLRRSTATLSAEALHRNARIYGLGSTADISRNR